MLDHGHNHLLVSAAFAIALMSGFTGLSLTQGASRMGVARRKLMVAMSAVALGSGIWSMHFVAMLGMRLPVPFYYDALVTLISAFVAILVTGVALLAVHFGERTPRRITFGGVCLALGIVAMHYIGKGGIQAVRPVYSATGVAIALLSALALCIAAFWITYGARRRANILVGTFAFAMAVFAVHFIAMAGTRFAPMDGAEDGGFWLSNDTLAFGVTLSSFVISGAFLLVSVSFASIETSEKTTATLGAHSSAEASPSASRPKIPYEQNGRIHFLDPEEVAAIRAEGRYSFVYHRSGRLFSPWSISEAENRTAASGFFRCHRSYLINPKFVTGFERRKDNGVCFFDGGQQIDKAPVSRSYLKATRAHLGV